MALRYQKPPLVEALCEVRFASPEGHAWDWTIPGMLYQRIQARFPARKERHAIAFPIGAAQVEPPRHAIERLQFASPDGTMIVQVGPDLLAVNSLRPHLGWPELRDTFLGVLGAYCELAAPRALTMAAVRYINRVEIPLRPGFALEKYFAVVPGLPGGVSGAVSTFLMHTEVRYEEPAAIFRFRFGTTATESADDVAAFMLDYEHVAPGPVAPTFDSLPAWLDVGHDRIERAFYGSFTEMTHAELFQETRP